MNSAQDAFGTTVGQESIGLYSTNSARGFNPRQAGNVRIEGLFFHGPVAGGGISLSNRLFGQSTIHVGLTAQSYPFPSPTGIADYSLRIPGDRYVLSAAARLGPRESIGGELDAQLPLVADIFSLGIGVSAERPVADHGTSFYKFSAAVIGRLRVGDNIEIIPFWSQERTDDNEFAPWIFTAGLFEPPKYKRSTSLVPTWSEINSRDSTFGAIARATWSDWQVRLGLFRAIAAKPDTKLTLYFNTQPDGAADRQFWSFPNSAFPSDSNSGELRVSRLFTEGPRHHTVNINARGRTSLQGSGGVDRVNGGRVVVGVAQPEVPEPAFRLLPRNSEDVRQGGLGLSYEGQWRELGEFSAGLQRVFYERTTTLPVTQATDSYWLYNATMAVYVSSRLALYSSYTRGLEDSPNAPAVSANEGRGVAASTTSQIDAGFRYTFGPYLKLVAGVFEVKKPFFAVDTANIYRQLGQFRHRGVEVSMTGEPGEGLRVVAGLVLLKARVSGDLVDQGAIGRVPAGSIPVTVNLNVQYGPPSWRGLSVDTRLTHDAAHFANNENTFKAHGETVVDLGLRYRTAVYEVPTTVRFHVTNVMNAYIWRIIGSERLFRPSAPRKVTLQVTADF